ncbi:hypothetical protein LCGC14_0376410 [marine sediment metagenome]|uniref:Uncharacterized protein n=1 Tax=marine sediment metagenome TaxID=412755 RepID=A0A0F9WCL5_9ZZZZ
MEIQVDSLQTKNMILALCLNARLAGGTTNEVFATMRTAIVIAEAIEIKEPVKPKEKKDAKK